jgi:hypothetical protein
MEGTGQGVGDRVILGPSAVLEGAPAVGAPNPDPPWCPRSSICADVMLLWAHRIRSPVVHRFFCTFTLSTGKSSAEASFLLWAQAPVCSRHEAHSDAQAATPFDSVPEPHDERAAGLVCFLYASQADEAREQASVPQVARSHVGSLRVWTVWLRFGPDEARERSSVPQVARLHVGSLRVWTPWIQFWTYLHDARKRAWLPCVAHSHVRSSQPWTTMTWMRSWP